MLVLSDIHGDLDALDSVLAAIDLSKTCGVVVTGDHCLGGEAPFEVWRRLHEIDAVLCRGLTDLALGTVREPPEALKEPGARARVEAFQRTQDALGDIVCRRLVELPTTAVVSLDDQRGVMVMHGAPNDRHRGLSAASNDDELAAQTACVAEDCLVVGLTHEPFARRLGPLLLVNAGSVGQSAHRTEAGQRTAHAVLIQSFTDGQVHAASQDIPVVSRNQLKRRAG